VVLLGTDSCWERYELIKPILDSYEKEFSVLDLGAAQGFFSFLTAENYPHSSSVMIEANNTSYAHHGDMLFDLCLLNKHLPNIYYLQKEMDLSDLKFLNQEEHFDIVFAFLVVHLMHETLKEQVKILDELLSLGDNLIIEVANDVGIIHTSFVEYLSSVKDCYYLGEVKRHKDPNSQSTGKLFWFKSGNPKFRNSGSEQCAPIKKTTFERLNGVFPKEKFYEADQ